MTAPSTLPPARLYTTWGTVLARGTKRVTTMGSDCHRNTFPPETIAAALVALQQKGGKGVDPAVTRRLLDQFVHRLPDPAGAGQPGAAADRLDGTTGREREVLALVAQGLSNAEIAAELVVTETTVKTHVHHLLTKLGVHSPTICS